MEPPDADKTVMENQITITYLKPFAWHVLAIVFAMLFAPISQQAFAQTKVIGSTPPIPVSLTLSGGVSLGAYQAGSLYYLSRFTQENHDLLDLKLITGASAGGTNALLSVLDFCGEENFDPEASNFWKAWASWTASALQPASNGGKGTDPRALLSRAPLEKIAADLFIRWQHGLPASCDVVIGVTITSLQPQLLKTATALKVERQSDEISLRIRGRGPGKAPLITNYALAASEVPQTILALTPGDDTQNFAALRDLVFASQAFPIVFAPQKLKTCTTDASPRWLQAQYPVTCEDHPGEITESEYVDGGLTDNEPIAYAYDLARDGLTTQPTGPFEGHVKWQEIPQAREQATPALESTLFINLDLSKTTFTKAKKKADSKRVLSLVGSVVSDFLTSSRDLREFTTLARNPHFANQIVSLENNFPRISDPMMGFFGFLERDFREFDFYLGMLEMRELTRDTIQKTLRQGGLALGPHLRLPDLQKMPPKSRARFSCLDAYLHEAANADKVCLAMNDAAFYSLTRLSLARLKTQNPDLSFISDFLTKENFEYRDLGLSRDDAGRAPAVIKKQAVDTVANLAAQQPTADAFTLRGATPLLIDSVAQLPNSYDFSLVFGPESTFEVSGLLQNKDPYAWRWTAGLSIENWPAWLSTGGGRIVPTSWVGAEWQPSQWSSSLVQTRIGLGIGYKFGQSDSDSTCAPGEANPIYCRGVEIRPSLSWTLIERLRLEGAFEIMPMRSSTGQVPIEFSPAIGLQFYF